MVRSFTGQGLSRPVKGAWLRGSVILISLLALLLPHTSPALAGSQGAFPEILPLPNGFRPEGIVIGRGDNFYVGSLADGSIYRGSLRTGQGGILVPPQTGRVAVGLSYDKRTDYIYAAGGAGGAGYVYDAGTGEGVAAFSFASAPTFVNDVVVTRDAAYFTDSFRPFLYRVRLQRDGTLPDPVQVDEIPLGGDYDFVPGAFNANGIDAPKNGRWLVIVQSNLGALYRVDPQTGHASRIDLGGDSVPNGDGLLLDGRTLYVVQNQLNQIAVIELEPRRNSGELEQNITNPNFRVTTTVDDFGKFLYVVNARFNVTPTPDTEYEVVRVSKGED